MEFRLVYQGSLPGSGNSSRHARAKHQIRKHFHRQLASLWENHPLLAVFQRRFHIAAGGETFLEKYAKRTHGFQWLSLVNEPIDQVCGLDILLLRRERPGSLITQGGDVDNRVKTLFDALSVPDSASGLTPPEAHETPFYCVMEKDKLVTQVSVTADRLLMPVDAAEPQNYVHAIINVRISVAMQYSWGSFYFTRNW